MEFKEYSQFYIHSFSVDKKENFNLHTKYHYTSPDAFLSIIKGGKIRFTDARFLNDKTEIKYFISVLIDFLNQNKKSFPLCLECVSELLKENSFNDLETLDVSKIKYNHIIAEKENNGKKKRIFIFCTSADNDSLNMWNYYVNNGKYQGYNIGININKFLKVFEKIIVNNIKDFQVYYGNVLYKEKDQFKEITLYLKYIENLIDSHLNLTGKQMSTNENRSNYINIGKKMIYQYIESRAAFYKHSKFADEREFRIVIEISEDCVPKNEQEATSFFGPEIGNMYEGFCAKNGLIVPFIQIEIPKNAIKQITVSPIMEFEIADKGIKELLLCSGIDDVEILHSEIPIRF